MHRTSLENILKYGVLAICISSVAQWLRIPIGPTALWWALDALMIWSMIRMRDGNRIPGMLVLWIVVVVLSSLVGMQYCRDYWDWKMLVGNVFNYAICTAVFLAFSPVVLQQVLSFLSKHFFKIFIALILFLSSDGIAKLMIPFSLLAIFYSALNQKMRRYVWAGLLITLIFGFDSRSDVLKYLFCMLIGLFSQRHDIIGYIRKFYWIFYFLPILLFILAAKGTFNVFNIEESLAVSEINASRINMADTRTELYKDVISTSIDRGTVLLGNTPARGYYSNWVINVDDKSDKLGDIHYGERGSTESGVLNVFLYFGIIGVLIYMLLFWNASYLGIFKSNNIYCPIIGLYVSFRFMVGWIEDFTRFDLNMFLLWVMIGICYSPYFREMTDENIEEWFEESIVR